MQDNLSLKKLNLAHANFKHGEHYKIIDLDNLDTLESLSSKHGFNMNFEGGEAETFVINCPLFKNSISIKKSKKVWDGYRGRFEILEAELENNVR